LVSNIPKHLRVQQQQQIQK